MNILGNLDNSLNTEKLFSTHVFCFLKGYFRERAFSWKKRVPLTINLQWEAQQIRVVHRKKLDKRKLITASFAKDKEILSTAIFGRLSKRDIRQRRLCGGINLKVSMGSTVVHRK